MSTCDRCGKTNIALKMSFFNTDMLCPECTKKEEAHPMYAVAKQIEHMAVRRGDYNYKGIGRPHDL